MLSHYNLISDIEAMVQVFWLGRRRPHRRRAALLPLLRLHSDHLAAADQRRAVQSTNPIRWTRRPPARSSKSTKALFSSPRPRSAATTCGSARRKSSRRCVSFWWARRNCASRPPRVSREVRTRTAGGLWMHRNGPCDLGKHVPISGPETTHRSAPNPGRSAIRCRESL